MLRVKREGDAQPYEVVLYKTLAGKTPTARLHRGLTLPPLAQTATAS